MSLEERKIKYTLKNLVDYFNILLQHTRKKIDLDCVKKSHYLLLEEGKMKYALDRLSPHITVTYQNKI